MFELVDIERVIQHPDIKDDIRIIRHAVFETEGFKSDGQVVVVVIGHDPVHLFLELLGIHIGSIKHMDVLLLVFVDDVLLDLKSFFDGRSRIGYYQRMDSSGELVAVDDRILVRIKQDQGRIEVGIIQ